jgi:hypothetical protein
MRLTLAILTLIAGNTFAVERYLDRSIPAHIRLKEVREELYQELRNPTPYRREKGGAHDIIISHEGQLCSIMGRFTHIVWYIDEAEKQWRKDEQAFSELSKILQRETDPEAREIIMVALARCGDKSCENELIDLVQRNGFPKLRGYAIEALGNNHCYVAIPALLKQLEDPYEIPGGCLDPGTTFPIRRYAMTALKRLGVRIQYDNGKNQINYVKYGIYIVDQTSVEAVMKANGDSK